MRRWIRRGAPWRECVTEDNNGCLIWQGRTLRGYGVRSGRLAHRLVYEEEIGPIPAGLTLDHLCRTTACVNPAHLEPVPIGVNLLRGNSFQGVNARKTHCPQGHPYDDSNTWFQSYRRNDTTYTRRRCRACLRVQKQRYLAAKAVSS